MPAYFYMCISLLRLHILPDMQLWHRHIVSSITLSFKYWPTWSWQELNALNLLWRIKTLLNITIMQTPLQWLLKSGRQRETGIFLPGFTYYGSYLQHWVFDRLKLVGFVTEMYGACLSTGRHVNGKEQLMRMQLDHLRMAHFQVWFSEIVLHLTVEMLVRKTCGMQDENNAGAIQSRLQF